MMHQDRQSCYPARRVSATALLSVAMVLSASAVARGQSKDAPADVKELRRQGEDLAKQGKSKEAIAKYDEAYSKFSVPQYLIFAGEEYEKQNKLVSARARYREAASLTLSPDALKKYKNAKLTAAEKLAAVEKLIPMVEVAVTGPSPTEVDIQVDDSDFELKLSNSPGVWHLDVNPGTRRIDLSAKGYVAVQCFLSASARSPQEEPLRCMRTMAPVPAKNVVDLWSAAPPPRSTAVTAQAPFENPISSVQPAATASSPGPTTERFSTVVLGVGIGAIVLGGAAIVYGSAAGSLLCSRCNTTAGDILLATGVLVGGAGVLMVYYGSRMVSIQPQTPSVTYQWLPTTGYSIGVPSLALRFNGSGLGLTGTF